MINEQEAYIMTLQSAYNQGKSSPIGLQEMLESLYNLDRWELRRLAAEALLVSDGPDSPHEINEQDPGTAVKVTYFPHGLFQFGVEIVEG